MEKLSRRKGHFTFRAAAVLFALSALLELTGPVVPTGATLDRVLVALSALLELTGMSLPAPLFGEFRGGTAALVYHLIYVLLFLALAVGLWTAKPWGYLTIFIGGVLYTLDKLQFLMSGNVTKELVNTIFRGQEPLLQAVGPGMVMLSLTLVVLAFIFGWWGFAYYAYLRRSYFKGGGG